MITESLLGPFGYDYMVKAMLAATLVGGVCGLLSCFVCLKGWSLLGDALSHAVVPGVALSFWLGLPLALGAFATGMLAVAGMGIIKARTRLKEDSVIGVVFTTLFALGLLMISVRPSGIDLKTVVFGNLLGVADADLLQMAGAALLVAVVVALKWRDLLHFTFDAAHARSQGVRTVGLRTLLLAMLSLAVVAGLLAVGAILVVALMVTPGATAYLLVRRFGAMLLLALALGAGLSFLGAWASYFLDGSVGGCIVLLQTLAFFAAFFFGPRHGLWRRRVEVRP